MQQTIVLKKSAGRFIFYGFMGSVLALMGLAFLVGAVVAHDHLMGILQYGVAGFALALTGYLSLGTAASSVGKLTVVGMQMDEKLGISGKTQHIDLSKVVKIEAKAVTNIVGGNPRMGQTTTEVSQTLFLTDADGSTFTLSPEVYNKAERVKLAPVLISLMNRSDIAKAEGVAKALEIWYSTAPAPVSTMPAQPVGPAQQQTQQPTGQPQQPSQAATPQVPTISKLEVSGQTTKQMHKNLLIFAAIMVSFVVLMTLLIVFVK